MSSTTAQRLASFLPAASLRRLAERRPQQFWLGVVLLGLSAVTHFMWLSYPHEVVFDEVHFGKFVTAYCCTGERFFDIHPPHAKLVIASAGYLLGFRGGHTFKDIGQSYGATSPLSLRFVPALVGTFLPLLIFVVLLQLGARDVAAFFGAAVVLFDNAMTVQTRVISLDGMLLLSIFGSLSLWLVALSKSGRARWLWLAAAGAAAGFAVGVKFTGLAAPALLGVLLLVQLAKALNVAAIKEHLLAGVVLLASALVVYSAGWALHFILLTEPGSGDDWRKPTWESPLIASFVEETVELHKIMLNANYTLEARHPDESAWWEWPLMRSSVFYWQHSNSDGRLATIYLLGNPLVWWGSTVLFVSMLADLASRRLFSLTALARARMPHLWIPLVGYVVALAPLTRVPRALFLYHYLTALIFAVLAISLWLDAGGFFERERLWPQPRRVVVTLGAIVVCFLIFSPLTYGFLISSEIQNLLFWLPTWR